MRPTEEAQVGQRTLKPKAYAPKCAFSPPTFPRGRALSRYLTRRFKG